MAQTPDSASHGRRGGKSPAAFRTISEVATELGLPQHVLRFWESKFTAVKPMKRGGGRRYYRPEDVRLLRRIRDLLYDDGYTIKGVQKLLREGGGKLEAAASSGPAQPAAPMSDPAHDPAPAADDGGDDGGPGRALRAELESIAGELENIRQLLDGATA